MPEALLLLLLLLLLMMMMMIIKSPSSHQKTRVSAVQRHRLEGEAAASSSDCAALLTSTMTDTSEQSLGWRRFGGRGGGTKES